jgi:protein-S-isoprenylcysteine O-methyltransferase Ste14
MKSLLFVSIQFVCLGYFVFSGSFLRINSPLIIIQLIGFIILGWAVIMMNPSQWTIFSEPKKLGNLIISGPFRWIRHPMYSGLLLISFSIILHRQTIIDFAVLAVFVLNLILKLAHEEALLSERFSEYKQYKKSTSRIFPWIYQEIINPALCGPRLNNASSMLKLGSNG